VHSNLSVPALTQLLEADLRTRADAIRARLPRDTGSDAERLLGTLRDVTATTIRPAPTAAQRALARTRNPDIGIAQLVQVVEEDPSLGQALLRYANSAYYSTGGVVVSLRHAAQRVGSAGVHNVVLGVMLDGMLCRPGAGFQLMLDQVRTHLVRTAPLARALGRSFGVLPDEAFALALLHDAGKLLVFDSIGALRHELRRDVSLAPAVVREILIELHEPLGGLAALRWGLGSPVAVAIATHHRRAGFDPESRMSELLFVAERGEHALSGTAAMDVGAWWNAGSLTTDAARVEGVLAEYRASEMAA